MERPEEFHRKSGNVFSVRWIEHLEARVAELEAALHAVVAAMDRPYNSSATHESDVRDAVEEARRVLQKPTE